MRKLRFYARMAGQNLWKNRLYYLPFFFTGAACAAMCYMMRSLNYSAFVAAMPRSVYVSVMLFLGSGVLAFLSVWIMAYADGFVMRRRRRELALYHILGMEKRHVGAVLGLETLLLAAGCIAAGVAGGAAFAQLALWALARLMQTGLPAGFEFSPKGAGETAAFFLALFFALYLHDLFVVRHTSPIELLHSDKLGEKEPKSRRLLAGLGLAALLAGYAIAAFTTDPVLVILLFFVAVALVIVGTHCLFGAGSVVALKALRKNKGYYYRPRHFTAVSGLIYRMAQNARGLANICILSTTVLVSVAVTVCLYAGMEGSLARNYPHEVQVRTRAADGQTEFAAFDAAVRGAASKAGLGADAAQFYTVAFRTVRPAGDGYAPAPNAPSTDGSVVRLTILPGDAYTHLTGQAAPAEGTVLFDGGAGAGEPLLLGTQRYAVAGVPAEVPALDTYVAYRRSATLVLADEKAFSALQRDWPGGGDGDTDHGAFFDPEFTNDEDAMAFASALSDAVAAAGVDAYTFSRAGSRAEYAALFGSFVFLGAFLAVIFTMAAALIIYYKQLTEGYEDRERFVILQKVGMSAAEVRGTIRSQVLLVFFLPLGTAGLHVAAAFPMLWRLVETFGLTDPWLLAGCAAVTFLVFALCYAAVYAATAKKYYRIVRM